MSQAYIDDIYSLLHDRYYDLKNPASYRSVDVLLKDVNKIQKESNRPQLSRSVVKEWLQGQEPYSAMKQIRTKFPKNKYKIPKTVGYHIQCDLIDVHQFSSENDGVKFLLGCIDLKSRYVFMEPLISKDSNTVLNGFKHIINKLLKNPNVRLKYVQCDQGKEFFNREFQSYLKTQNMKLFSSGKPVFIERFNRTFLTILYKVHTKTRSRRTIDMLQQLISNYNHSYHRGIKASPYEIFFGKKEPLDYVISNASKIKMNKLLMNDRANELPLNSLVRVSWNSVEGSNLFTKGYHSKWSEELFRVYNKKINPEEFIIYYLQDLTGEKIEGSGFYRLELNPVPDRVLKAPLDISNIIRYRKLKGRPREALVTFSIYPKKYKEWIRADTIEDVVV